MILDAGPCPTGALGALYARPGVQESTGRTESMMRMQQCIIGCLMAADHVFTMTGAPQGHYRDRGEKRRRAGVKQGGREDGKKTQGEDRGRKQRGRLVVKA